MNQDSHDTEQYYLRAVFDHLRTSLCVVSTNGQVVRANRAAKHLFGRTSLIGVNSHGLYSQNSKLNVELQQAINQVTRPGTMSFQTCIVLLAPANETQRILVDIEALTIADGSEHQRGALVTLIQPDVNQPYVAEWVERLYKFSKTESRICRFLIDGWTMREIADERNVGIETVKSQVKSIRLKTGCTRRAALIQLVMRNQPLSDVKGRGLVDNTHR